MHVHLPRRGTVSADRGPSGVRPRRFLGWVRTPTPHVGGVLLCLERFILFYAYGSRFGVGLKAEAIGAFLAARVSRIYPLQLATLLAVAILEIDRRTVASRHAQDSSSASREIRSATPIANYRRKFRRLRPAPVAPEDR